MKEVNPAAHHRFFLLVYSDTAKQESWIKQGSDHSTIKYALFWTNWSRVHPRQETTHSRSVNCNFSLPIVGGLSSAHDIITKTRLSWRRQIQLQWPLLWWSLKKKQGKRLDLQPGTAFATTLVLTETNTRNYWRYHFQYSSILIPHLLAKAFMIN